ncbi:hypothetical protein CPLU01_09388 [Colletotrichum plurivorum]|uniref:Uncharacterized protein n=2 Tax=Colletotrichum orchidearum species complex TaxID=2707337 RepID=A0A8H6NBM0_9PEZI|nr:hypothetical protein CSOJ01_07137 [Colletotrichum sojae]KAF6826908.1 hypothetical protein CPLU01_09388 [Colletotrichum plurivorum]
MQIISLTIFSVLAAQVLGAPATEKPAAGSLQQRDDNDKKPPFDAQWLYCQTKCDCSQFDPEEPGKYDVYFQCITNPNCEQCERLGMSPPSK